MFHRERKDLTELWGLVRWEVITIIRTPEGRKEEGQKEKGRPENKEENQQTIVALFFSPFSLYVKITIMSQKVFHTLYV